MRCCVSWRTLDRLRNSIWRSQRSSITWSMSVPKEMRTPDFRQVRFPLSVGTMRSIPGLWTWLRHPGRRFLMETTGGLRNRISMRIPCMSDLPVVSVVIPCLNRAHLLGPTIESVLQQDYPQVECVVVDGGSSDGTVEILQSYGESLKWVSEPDGGHADAINKGWHMS